MQRKLQRSVIEIRRSSATRPYESRSLAVPIWRIIDGVGYEQILVDVEPPIATVTLNRPKVLNALSPELVGEVNQALRELDADDNVHAVVLTGGSKVFAAGADIGDMAERTAVEQLHRDQTGRWAGIAAFTKPLIAAVNGYALGGGCELAEKAPLALRMAKEAVLKAFEGPLAEGLAAERKSFYFLFSTEDQKEGMRAFLEKRKAVFKGRYVRDASSETDRIFGAHAAHLRCCELRSSLTHQRMRSLRCSLAPSIWTTWAPNLSVGPLEASLMATQVEVHVNLHVHDGIALIQLNRPEKMNAIGAVELDQRDPVV